MSKRRVVVTGMGVLSPLGCDLNTFWDRLTRGESGIRSLTYFDTSAYTSRIGGELTGFNPGDFISPKEQRRQDPFTQYGVASAKLAIGDSGLDLNTVNLERAGVIFASGIGGLQILQDQMRTLIAKGPSRFSPFMIPQMITNIVAGQIAIDHQFRGPNFCITSACASATHSIGEGLRIIQHGEADVMIVGGSEASLCELGVGGFCALRALSTRNDEPTRASRPFDRDRDGFVIAEGAAALIIEELEHARKRGARMYCELAGYGRTCDAYHITAPDELGRGAARGMKLAVEDAGLNPEQIDYINAHGTSTELNDKCETMAIKAALGEDNARRLAISSNKSMIGHTLGAAGGIESVACALTIKHGVIPPTINLENPDPACDLDYVPNVAREQKVRACLNNSLGFGGHNATLCFKAMD
ncbi:MAG TPA: beta-ketoacyl-ACP synthase II [Kiritimatiellia bacterium]|nr:beta-ketoacyl-ACP synthase II [Kiritimatiellia bacterium]HMO99139.1 beta-ketoacyl-ACP synthase II [Kiritimatiellia bacterium]HMP95683.1 beta-ketoacyl-ACP synthase II [Kiritimatiellia bacterium]